MAGVGRPQRTTVPMVTGSSVVGIRCCDGVVLATDTLASYGSLARFKGVCRMFKVSEETVIGVGGEFSDFQDMVHWISDGVNADFCMDDGHRLGSKAWFHAIADEMFHKRMQLDPWWNFVVLGGMEKGKPFLGLVDLYGTNFESEVIATGFGMHLGLPLLRKAYRPDITVEEGKTVVTDIMRVLYYRDARSSDEVQLSVVTAQGAVISDPIKLETQWEFKRFISGDRSGESTSS